MIPKFLTLFSGFRFNLEQPADGQYPIDDIARGLAHAARFGGQTEHWFSVAQHSVNGSYCLEDPRDQYTFLFHDATEGVMGMDVPTPMKWKFLDLKTFEEALHPILALQFDFDHPYNEKIKNTDTDMLVIENKYLRGNREMCMFDIANYDISHVEDKVDMSPWTPVEAKERWLARFEELKHVARIEV